MATPKVAIKNYYYKASKRYRKSKATDEESPLTRAVLFTEGTTLVESQSAFLNKLNNKERFISQLSQQLQCAGTDARISIDDAYL